MEQVKVDVAYSHTNVKLIGISGGISYGALGMTHHSAQDIAALASIPGLRVYLPSDRFLTQALLEVLVEDNDPAYIRVGRNAVEDVYDSVPENFQMDKALTVREGTDVTIVANLLYVKRALEAADELAKEGISAEVIDPRTLVPFDYDTVAESVKKTGRLVVVHEAHQNNGWGAQVVSQVGQMVFPYLDAAPVHIGAKACPLPFNLGLEQAVLPSVKDIVDACKASLYR